MKTPMHRISSRSMSNVLAAGLLLAGLAAGARAQDLAPGSRPGIAGEREGPREGDPRRRDRYWQRLNNGLSPAAMARAAAEARRLPAARSLPRTSGYPDGLAERAVAPGGSPWQFFGPRPILADTGVLYSGRVTALAVGPAQTLYAGGANGGVWKSADGGATWAPMNGESTIGSLAIGSIAIDPTNSNVIYAGTGEPNFGSSQPGRGVLKSSDGGGSWTLLGSGDPFPPGTSTNRVLVGPTGTVWVASDKGLHRSTSGGSTWKRIRAVHGFPDGRVWDVAMAPNGNLMYAVVDGIGVYRSQDGGGTWGPVGGGLPAASVFTRRARIAIAPSRRATAYVVIAPVTTNIQAAAPPIDQIYVTTDTGATWTRMPVNDRAGHTYNGYNLEVAVDPLNPNLPYVGGLIWTAPFTDVSGTRWLQVGSFLHADQHAIAFLPCTVSPCPYVVGNDGGVYRVDPQSGSPHAVFTTNLNSDLELTELVGGDLGINFVSEPFALGGTQDNGTIVYEPSFPGRTNPLEWSQTLGADGGQAFLPHQPVTSTLAYTEQQLNEGLYRSTNRGDDWSRFDAGLTFAGEFYAVYTLDKRDENHLAYADGRIVRETTGGAWYQSSQDLGASVTALAFASGDGAILYAGTQNGRVFRTTAAGSGGASTYQDAGNGLPATLRINALAVDPLDANVVYAAGSNSAGSPNVFRTENGGQTWTSMQGSLPGSLPVYSVLAYRSTTARVVVIGTFAGAYFTADQGVTWSSLNAGLPNTKIARVAIDRDQTTIAAFTAGRGAFSTNIGGGPCTYSIAPPSQSFAAGGGTGSVGVTTQPGCPWTAASNAFFVTVTGGASGLGSGTVTFSVAANGQTSPRSGTLTIAGETFTVNQDGSVSCSYSLSPASASFAVSGGAGSFNVNTTPGCLWSAASGAPWITITGGSSGSGSGTVSYQVAANPNAQQRTGTISVAGRTFTVTQAGGSPSCSYSLSKPSSSFPVNGGTGLVGVNAPAGCSWAATSNDEWILVTGGASGVGNGTVSFFVAANTGGNGSPPRTGTLTIAGLTFTVFQDGTP